MKRYLILLSAIAAAILALVFQPVLAQTEPPTPTPTPEGSSDIPLTHIVQSGETLTIIAELYNTTVEVLQQINNISDPELVFAGQELLVPGGGGTEIPTVYTTRLGDTLEGLAADFNTTRFDIAETNRLLNPYYLVSGQSLTIFSRTGTADPQPLTGTAHVVQSGDTLLTIAARYGQTPAAILAANDLSIPTYLFPGQRLRIPAETRYQYLPGGWAAISIHPVTAFQGQTLAIYAEHLDSGQPNGQFLNQELRFTPAGERGYVALVGIDAFTEPGDYPLFLTGIGEHPWRPFRQNIRISSSSFGVQQITVSEDLAYLLAPEIRAEEDEILAIVYGQFNEARLWEGLFQMPLSNTVVTAGYGDARSYNGGPIEIYHTGIDFSGGIGTPIYAPANGRVVYSDTMPLRGNVLIIDHGHGVMSGFYHLSKIVVPVGELVRAGQIVAEGGNTGLSTGPHLHWDLRVMNVTVNPIQWTEEIFP